MQSSFKRTWSAKDLIISIGTALVGVAIIFMTSGWFSAIGTLILVVGICLIPCMRSSYHKDGKAYRKAEFNIPRDEKAGLLEFFDGTSDKLDLTETVGQGGSLLEVYWSKGGSVFAQLFEFVDFSYAPQSELIELTGKKAEKVLAYIK